MKIIKRKRKKNYKEKRGLKLIQGLPMAIKYQLASDFFPIQRASAVNYFFAQNYLMAKVISVQFK